MASNILLQFYLNWLFILVFYINIRIYSVNSLLKNYKNRTTKKEGSYKYSTLKEWITDKDTIEQTPQILTVEEPNGEIVKTIHTNYNLNINMDNGILEM